MGQPGPLLPESQASQSLPAWWSRLSSSPSLSQSDPQRPRAPAAVIPEVAWLSSCGVLASAGPVCAPGALEARRRWHSWCGSWRPARNVSSGRARVLRTPLAVAGSCRGHPFGFAHPSPRPGSAVRGGPTASDDPSRLLVTRTDPPEACQAGPARRCLRLTLEAVRHPNPTAAEMHTWGGSRFHF